MTPIKKRKNYSRTSVSVISGFVLFIACMALSSCSHVSPSVKKTAAAENSFDRIHTRGWDTLDDKLKQPFIQEYKHASDDRVVYRKYLPLIGATAILQYLEQKYSLCHGVAHNLGKELYVQSQDLMRSLQICGKHCTGACMHGAIGEAFGGGMHGSVASHMESFCGSEAMALHKRGNCAHAMGHALMMNTAGDLGQSLENCQQFEKPSMQYYCATGVYMQYSDWLADGTIDAKRPSLHYPCDRHKLFPAACYRYTLSAVEEELDYDLDKLIQACRKLKNPQRYGCFHGLGGLYLERISENPSLITAVCLAGDETEQVMCIEGVIEKLADMDEQKAHSVCALLKDNNAQTCRAAARDKMYQTDKPSMKHYIALPEETSAPSR